MSAAVLERDPGPRHEILHGARDQDLPRTRGGDDPGADVDRDAADIFSHQLALARVQARAEFHSELPHRLPDSTGAADRPRRAVEGCHEAVSHRLDLSP